MDNWAQVFDIGDLFLGSNQRDVYKKPGMVLKMLVQKHSSFMSGGPFLGHWGFAPNDSGALQSSSCAMLSCGSAYCSAGFGRWNTGWDMMTDHLGSGQNHYERQHGPVVGMAGLVISALHVLCIELCKEILAQLC